MRYGTRSAMPAARGPAPAARDARSRDSVPCRLERTPTCALDVHSGMPDTETAIATFTRLRGHLPLLQALAAHSPYWHGRASGFATARAQLFRGFPRAVIPRAFAGWDDYVSSVRSLVDAGDDTPAYPYMWWEVRPDTAGGF